ncbi:hypothetical protein [Thermomonas sp.]|nr:hypothetical protein [Thermomonas sp.]
MGILDMSGWNASYADPEPAEADFPSIRKRMVPEDFTKSQHYC